jgi:tetratricopeptide (TPR) repeat protein
MPTATTYVDFYDILDVTETASLDEIKKALRQQRQVWVKKQTTSDLGKRQRAETRVAQLDEAERVLLDPTKRNQFNQTRKTARPESTPTDGVDGNWLDRARAFLEAGQMPSANYASREAISNDGASHEAWSIRAQSSFSLGNWRDAEYEFLEAIRLRPDEAEYHFDLGCAYEAAGQHKSALGKFEDALKIQPQNPMYKTAIASIYLKNGVTERARPIMEEVVREHPNVEAFQYYLAWAIADSFDDYCTTLQNGSYVLTSPEQIAKLRSEMNRAKGLRFHDEEMRAHINQRLASAVEAEKIVWRRPSYDSLHGKFWIATFLFGIVLIAAYGLGIVVIGLAAFGYFKLFKMPKWRADAKDLKGSRLVSKWGIGARP